MADTLYTTISSPIDDLLLTGDGERLTRLYMRPVDGSDCWRDCVTCCQAVTRSV